MKVLQEQYNLIKEGKGNKAHFLKTAFRLFPDMLSPVNTFEDTVKILKNRSILSEGIGGIATKGTTPDWHKIFKENLYSGEEWSLQPEGRFWILTYRTMDGKKEKTFQSEKEAKEWIKNNLKENKITEAKEVKPAKEVTDMETKGYDYKDKKNYDNVFGEEFLKGFYTEMGDPKNEGKDVNELKQIVAKNLAKDCNYYVKDGQFGVKGVGYTTEAPGLGTPKEAKGKFKSSGYGDLKESVLRAFISETIKEVLAENMGSEDELYNIISKYVKDADEVNAELNNYYEDGYKGFSDSVQANLSRDPEFQSWVQKGHDEETFKREIGEALTPEDEEEFTRAVEDAEQLYEKTGSIEGAMKYLPKEYNRFRAEIEQHLIQKYEG